MHQIEARSALKIEGNHAIKSRRLLKPGVILLTARQELVYITPTAQRILIHLGQVSDGSRSMDGLPPVIKNLCDTIEDARRHCASPAEWAFVHIHRMTLTAHRQIELGGFIVPERGTPPSHRLMIVLEMLITAAQTNGTQTMNVPQLTARQESVARGLMRGLTNKELAAELSLSAHTVKEYVRAIMAKYEATTRAGVVACLVSGSRSITQIHRVGRAASRERKTYR